MTLPKMLRPHFLVYIFCTLMLMQPLLYSNEATAATMKYAVVLSSAPGSNLKWTLKHSELLKGRTLFIKQAIIKGKQYERLYAGFFDTRKQATSFQKQIHKVYPGAWIQQTTTDVTPLANVKAKPTVTLPPRKKKTQKPAAVVPKVGKGTSTLSDDKLASLMQRAKTEFKTKKYSKSIRLLNAVLSAGKHKYSAEALELLGLARQRKGQSSHAVAAYEKYLKLYPDGAGADRVRQRLAGLLTATSKPREKLRMATIKEIDENTTYGSFSQYYRRNVANTEAVNDLTTLSQLISFIDLTNLHRSNKFDHRLQFTADHTYDLLNRSDRGEFRFIETYFDLSYRKTGTSGRIGRQSLRLGGILKRFDGISAGYQITPEMRVNILGGYPVDVEDKTSINDHKTFAGFTFETGTFLEHWDMNIFYFDQEFDGLQDREALGTEVRYRDNRMALFGMIDYDLFYKAVNIFQLNGNIIFPDGRTAYMNAFMRKAPILATSNALIGQTQRTIEELREVLNIEQVYQLARDRTANSQTITIGGSQPISEKWQVAGDFTSSRIGDTVATPASTGILEVPATPGTGPDFFISTQLVGNSLFRPNDTTVFGIRYYDTEPSNTLSLIANTRFPVTRLWRINPRLQYDIRELSNGRNQEKLRFIFRTDYRYLNKARFDFEIGYDETTEELNNGSLGNNNLFLNLGYRWDF